MRQLEGKFKVLDEKVTKDSNKDDSSYSIDAAVSPLEMLGEVCSTRYEVHSESALLSEQAPSTLRAYIGYSCKDLSLTSLIQQRLFQESKRLNPLQKFGSLILDEMSIKPSLEYVRSVDKFVGTVDMGGLEKELGIQDKLANRLLSFVFVDLFTHYRLPVSCFFAKELKGAELYEITLNVIKELEDLDFKVIRLVADNSKINVLMFNMLSNGVAKPQITHPFNSERPLFLSYDYCHVIKNTRSLFLARQFKICGNFISAKYARNLYEFQNKDIIKLVRNLPRKHVYPSNFEKMNVHRAVQLFSTEMTAGLRVLQKYGPQFGIEGFSDALPTIEFMERMYK
ncbi:THAP domain-containing protein 9, partial [Stegodyphus mimosarum]